MTRVLVMTIPAQGHLRPALAVAGELLRRGHDVDVLTTGALAQQVSATGARPVPYGTAWDRDARTTPPGEVPASEVAAWAPLVMLTEAAAQLEAAATHLRAHPADVLLYDTTTRTAARCTAHAHGLPAVELHCSLAPPPGGPTLADLRDPATGALLAPDPRHPALTEAHDRTRRLLADHGHPVQDPAVLARTAENHTLVAVPTVLQPGREAFDATTTFTGPLVGPAGPPTGWGPPTSGRPVALLTFGTEPPVPSSTWLAPRVQVLVEAGFHVVVTTAAGERAVGAGSPHADVLGWVPLGEVLPHAAVAVVHAGAGTVSQCLRHAVPCVLSPRTPEQDAVAQATARLGTGRLLRHGATAADLATEVAALHEHDGAATAARRVADDVARDRGAPAAADVLELAAAGGTAPSPRPGT